MSPKYIVESSHNSENLGSRGFFEKIAKIGKKWQKSPEGVNRLKMAIFWAITGYFLKKHNLSRFALLWDDSTIYLGEI